MPPRSKDRGEEQKTKETKLQHAHHYLIAKKSIMFLLGPLRPAIQRTRCVHLLDLIDMSSTFQEENYTPNAAARARVRLRLRCQVVPCLYVVMRISVYVLCCVFLLHTCAGHGNDRDGSRRVHINLHKFIWPNYYAQLTTTQPPLERSAAHSKRTLHILSGCVYVSSV